MRGKKNLVQKKYDMKYFSDRDHLSLHILNALEILLEKNQASTVLEVGVGSGKLMKALKKKGYKVSGIDSSSVAAKLAGVKITSATKLPYKDSQFDCLVSINVIEHLSAKDGARFIQEAQRVLKNEGFIFLVTPNYASVLRLFFGKNWAGYHDKTHIFFYTPLSLKRLLKEKGFTNAQFFFKITTPVIEWPLPRFVHALPPQIRLAINFLLASSPFALFCRDTFWISAKKKM